MTIPKCGCNATTRSKAMPGGGEDRMELQERIFAQPASLPNQVMEHGSQSNPSHTFSGPQESPGRVSTVETQVEMHVPRLLGTVDVMALIINKMVGGGIFTTPGVVLGLTGSKELALGLWTLGGVYTAICVTIYLQYGTALPFTGAEFIYLGEVIPKPKLLSTILFAGYFICISNNAGNALVFSKQILVVFIGTVTNTEELNRSLVTFLAVALLFLSSLLLYFSSRLGMVMNRLFAIWKIVLLVTCFVAGAVASKENIPGSPSGLPDFTSTSPTSFIQIITALIYVLYTYQGWENAFYVAGEVEAENQSLWLGAYIGITLVSILYVLVTTGYYLACDSATITDLGSDLGMALDFGPKAFKNAKFLPIAIATSALGNLNAVSYTSAKVKQAIATQRIIPFYRYIEAVSRFGTPVGGIAIHFIVTTILIVFTPNTSDGYSFIVGIWTWGQVLVGIFIAAGFLRLDHAMRQRFNEWTPANLVKKTFLRALALVYLLLSGIIVGFSASTHTAGTIPRWLWPVVVFCVLALSGLYWIVLRILQMPVQGGTVGNKFGFKVEEFRYGDPHAPDSLSDALRRSWWEGSRRRMYYTPSGLPKRVWEYYHDKKRMVAQYFRGGASN